MKPRKASAFAVIAALALVVGLVFGESQNIKEFTLFNGVNAADSSEQASPWIPIRGAKRVFLRVWSAGAAADTDFCDTVLTWKTLLSDSVLFMARDSLGTIVTARSTQTNTGAFPMCADSIVITGTAADSVKGVSVLNDPSGVANLVRGSVNGSGYYTYILPSAAPGTMPLAGVNLPNTQDVLMPNYMRIRVTPRTRLTTAGFSSTEGLRTRGIHALKVKAYVLYENR